MRNRSIYVNSARNRHTDHDMCVACATMNHDDPLSRKPKGPPAKIVGKISNGIGRGSKTSVNRTNFGRLRLFFFLSFSLHRVLPVLYGLNRKNMLQQQYTAECTLYKTFYHSFSCHSYILIRPVFFLCTYLNLTMFKVRIRFQTHAIFTRNFKLYIL